MTSEKESPDESHEISKSPDVVNDDSNGEAPLWRKILDLLTYTPKRCRYDPDKPPSFSMALNLLFGFAATFTVANLYYNHPILNILAEDFHVTNEKAS